MARHYILQWSKGVQRFYWYAWNDKFYGTLYNFTTGTVEKAGRICTGGELASGCYSDRALLGEHGVALDM